MSSSYREVLRKNALETFRFDESHDGDDWIITICHDIICNECRCTVKEIVRNQVVNEHDTTFVRSHSAITVAADVNILGQALNIDSRDKLFEPGRWIYWRPSKIDRKRRSRSPSSAASKTSSKIPRRDKRKYETTEYYIASTAKTFFTGLNTILDQQAEQLIEDVKALLVDGTTKSFIAHWKKCKTEKIEAKRLFAQTHTYDTSSRLAAGTVSNIANIFSGFPQHYLAIEQKRSDNGAFSWGRRTNRLVMLISRLTPYYGNVATTVLTLFAGNFSCGLGSAKDC